MFGALVNPRFRLGSRFLGNVDNFFKEAKNVGIPIVEFAIQENTPCLLGQVK
jgi:hypothetical protein